MKKIIIKNTVVIITTIKIINNKIIITIIMITVILVTMQRHNRTNDINNDNFSYKFDLASFFK